MRVFAAVDVAADMAETNWKHKVTPDQGDLKKYIYCKKSNAACLHLFMYEIYKLKPKTIKLIDLQSVKLCMW